MSKSNVFSLVEPQPADDPDVVLEWSKGEMTDCLIIGYDKNGEIFAASSGLFEDCGQILWLLEMFKSKVMNGDFNE